MVLVTVFLLSSLSNSIPFRQLISAANVHCRAINRHKKIALEGTK